MPVSIKMQQKSAWGLVRHMDRFCFTDQITLALSSLGQKAPHLERLWLDISVNFLAWGKNFRQEKEQGLAHNPQ